MIESIQEDEKSIGVIDCNSKKRRNPAISKIDESGVDEIEFILMTHPHNDHFSGLEEVLDYCSERGIYIKRFYHPVTIGERYFDSIIGAKNSKSRLKSLFDKVFVLRQQDVIRSCGYVMHNTQKIRLSDDTVIQFLSPSSTEMEDFIDMVVDEGRIGMESSAANIISVITAIVSTDWYALMTADAPESVFDRLGTGRLEKVDRNLILGQIPHHGSERNYSHEFWKRRKNTGHPHFAGISVGPNSNDHPSQEVIEALETLNYQVHRTWLPASTERSQKASRMLDAHSRLESSAPSETKNDILYRLSSEGLDELILSELG